MHIVLNSDREIVSDVNNQLKDNIKKYGKPYCPCALEHNDDTTCMCKEFVENIEQGECPCGKFIKIPD